MRQVVAPVASTMLLTGLDPRRGAGGRLCFGREVTITGTDDDEVIPVQVPRRLDVQEG
jgi:hypothetical protein